MTVRAKFRVTDIRHIATTVPNEVAAEIHLPAVWGDGKGNETWSKATPSGDLKMMITNPEAIEQFDLGKDYYMDFTPAG